MNLSPLKKMSNPAGVPKITGTGRQLRRPPNPKDGSLAPSILRTRRRPLSSNWPVEVMAVSRLTKKFHQIAIGAFAIVSLSVSSVAACMCSHHEATKRGSKPRSCHAPSKAQRHGHATSEPDHQTSVGENCSCAPSAASVLVKAEGFKLRKYSSATTGSIDLLRPSFFSPISQLSPNPFQEPGTRRSDRPPSSRGPPQK